MLKRLAPLLPVILAAAVMYVVWPKPSNEPSYNGKTVAEWETEIESWSYCCPMPQPIWKSWLQSLGWDLPNERGDDSLFVDDDPAAVRVLIELCKSKNPLVQRLAILALS